MKTKTGQNSANRPAKTPNPGSRAICEAGFHNCEAPFHTTRVHEDQKRAKRRQAGQQKRQTQAIRAICEAGFHNCEAPFHTTRLHEDQKPQNSGSPSAKAPHPMKKPAQTTRQAIEALQAAGVILLTKTQMAAALQVSPRTLQRMMRRGLIRYYTLGPRLLRFRIEDARERMDQAALTPTKPCDPGSPQPPTT